jgi:hypothetical protein
LHPYSYSSKFPPLTPQRAEELGAPLPEDCGNRTGVGGKFQFAAPCIGYVNPHRKGSWQVPANDYRQRLFTAAPRFPFGKGRIGGQDVLERSHDDGGGETAAGRKAGATRKGRRAPN